MSNSQPVKLYFVVNSHTLQAALPKYDWKSEASKRYDITQNARAQCVLKSSWVASLVYHTSSKKLKLIQLKILIVINRAITIFNGDYSQLIAPEQKTRVHGTE